MLLKVVDMVETSALVFKKVLPSQRIHKYIKEGAGMTGTIKSISKNVLGGRFHFEIGLSNFINVIMYWSKLMKN